MNIRMLLMTGPVRDAYGNRGLIYQGQSGAMNEAFSDIFGEAMEFARGEPDDWVISPGPLGEALLIHPAMSIREDQCRIAS